MSTTIGLEDVVIGRGTERSATHDPHRHRLELRLPGSTISSVHARLECRPDAWYFIDANSRNGRYARGASQMGCQESERPTAGRLGWT